jgi:phospholipid/cholesterol/gamma-HCH transport system substrate-binding protein
MKSRRLTLADVKVGMTIFIGLLILLFLFVVVGTEQNIFVPTYTLKLFVTDLKGVVPGSMVTLGGMKVGHVDKMEFARYDNKEGIVIVLNVRKENQHSITTSSSAVIKTIGMLGDKYVDISFSDQGQAVDENGFLRSRTTLDLSDAADSVQTALNKFGTIITDMQTVTRNITSGRGTVGKLLMDTALAHDLQMSVHALGNITEAFTQRKGSMGKLVYDDQLYAKLSQTADNIHSLSDSVRSGSGSLGKLVRDDSLYAAMHRLALSLNTVFARAASDSSSVGNLLNSDEFYRKLSAMLVELNALIAEMKENPKKFFHISVF